MIVLALYVMMKTNLHDLDRSGGREGFAMPELLAPVGSEESLKMAVLNGADAVYMGGPMFNARAGAQNFSLAQLEAAAEYCHVRGVKAYLT